MKRLIYTFLLLLVSINMLWAQAEINKQINTIKRSGEYLYEESTMNNEVEAKEVATQMLTLCINDFIAENKLPCEKEITVADLKDVEYLKMKRGAMVCVFAYVRKSLYTGEKDVDVKGNEQSLNSDNSQLQESSDMQDPVIKQEVKVENIEKKETLKKQEETPISQPIQTETLSQENIDNVIKEPEKQDNMTSIEQTTPENQIDVIQTELLSWQQTAIDDLLQKKNLQDVVELLKRKQASRVIRRFGTYTNCQNPAQSCWIICDIDSNMTLITILGTGTTERMNFRTGSMDSLINYSGKNAIWFEFIK